MSIVPTVVISNVAFGNAYGDYNGTDINWASQAYKGDGYYGYTDGLHTVSYQLTGFVGILTVQASLATAPTENDWFNIDSAQIGDAVTAITNQGYFNFFGNFVWIRIGVTSFTAGTINKVLYS
jgi:multisubunit Na+/H+ antiporter MnhB subunit